MSSRKPILVQVSTSNGGMPKLAVLSSRVTKEGLEGDWQKNRKYHGGPNRAVCLYSVELYDELARDGIPLPGPGSVGENFTTQYLDLRELGVGSRVRVGPVLIEVTKVRVPCKSLNQWHPELMTLIQGRSGWMAKVIEEGYVRAGDEISVMG